MSSMLRPQEAADDDAAGEGGGRVDAAEAFDGGLHQALGGVGLGQVADALDHLDGRAEGCELVDHSGGRITDDEVVAPLREQAGDVGSDVHGSVADDGDPAGHVTPSSACTP